MAVRSGMYSSNKRKKELMRQKKQEDKRLRRQKNVKVTSQEAEGTGPINCGSDSSENTPEVTGKQGINEWMEPDVPT